VTSTIVGISDADRVRDTVDLASQTVPDELWDRLEALAVDRSLWLD
jgi:aryl-alcohol dehydrogenase-like predicted oxidoreductase